MTLLLIKDMEEEKKKAISPSEEEEDVPLKKQLELPPRFVIGCSDEDFEDPPDDEETHIVPPDGGWGWVVVAASFMCNLVVDGVIFTSGMLYPKLKETFNASNAEVAWISSLLGGFYLIVGPFVSSLANAYGFRVVCILGAVVCAISGGISYFATSIYYLYGSFGILGGMGLGLIYVPAVIATGFYFEKKRALATGIAVCGSGIGTFTMAPLTTYILTNYEDNWQIIFVVFGGIILTCAVYALAFRPLSAATGKRVRLVDESDVIGTPLLLRIKRARDRELALCPSALSMASYSRSPSIIEDYNVQNGDIKSPPGNINVGKTLFERHGGVGLKRQSFPAITVSYGPDTIPEESETNTEENNSSGGVISNGGDRQAENGKLRLLDNNKNVTPQTKKINFPDVVAVVDQQAQQPFAAARKLSWQRPYPRIESAPTFLHSTEYQRRSSRQYKSSDKNRPLYRDDIFYSGSLMRIPQYKSNETVYASSTVACPAADQTDQGDSRCCPVACSSVLKRIFDFSLLRSITFIVLSVTGFMALLSLFVPFNFLPSYAKDLGIDPADISFMMSLIGICNTAGRITAGWVSDHPKVDALLVNNVALIVGGAATISLPFLKSLSLLYAFCVVFGLCVAAFASLRSILLVELLGLEKLTNAFGLLLLFQGFAATFGSPVAGAFVDLTGDYNISFYVFGGLFALSGILCIPLRRIKKWEDDRIDKACMREKYGVAVE